MYCLSFFHAICSLECLLDIRDRCHTSWGLNDVVNAEQGEVVTLCLCSYVQAKIVPDSCETLSQQEIYQFFKPVAEGQFQTIKWLTSLNPTLVFQTRAFPNTLFLLLVTALGLVDIRHVHHKSPLCWYFMENPGFTWLTGGRKSLKVVQSFHLFEALFHIACILFVNLTTGSGFIL